MDRIEQAMNRFGTRPVLGVGAFRYDPTFLEIAALVGFQAAWIEMEHTFMTFAQAADMCRIASGLGMLTMLRVPDSRRETVLKGAECGPDIIDLPMVTCLDQVHELIRNARFPPNGVRGFFGVSRAVHYGLKGKVPEEQQKLNQELCLMVQVETKEALENIEEICRVADIQAIFIGPADLSASLGVPGETGNPRVLEASEHIVGIARKHGKHTAVGAPPSELSFWARQHVDILFCQNDIACLKAGVQAVMKQVQAVLANVDPSSRLPE